MGDILYSDNLIHQPIFFLTLLVPVYVGVTPIVIKHLTSQDLLHIPDLILKCMFFFY